jgi:RNA polymerase sigma factor (sigma-70 family)
MVGDEAELYKTLAVRLERIVRAEVRAPQEVIEDACHHAWTQLINHTERVERTKALTWLTRTAIRQAWKLNQRERRELSLEVAAETQINLPISSPRSGPVEQLEARERLGAVDQLPERQRRLIWLRAMGLSYVEMAAYTGDSERTVERQILRATDRVRRLDAEREALSREMSSSPRMIPPPEPVLRRAIRGERGLER